METEYKKRISKIFPVKNDELDKMMNHIVFEEVPSGTILLWEGDIASKLFIVIHGCLRTYLIKRNGTEITAQFFIENQMVASFESAFMKIPSRFYIETIEDSTLGVVQIDQLKDMFFKSPAKKDYFIRFLMSRLVHYMNHHASFILDSPEERYMKLIDTNPELESRIPKQYLASYLGITPVSLSRIRTRIKKQINNC